MKSVTLMIFDKVKKKKDNLTVLMINGRNDGDGSTWNKGRAPNIPSKDKHRQRQNSDES